MDVDDLIRVADEALDGIVTGMWPPALDGYEWQGDANFIAAAPDLVRRLRDALVDEREHRMELRAILGQIERKESHETCQLLQERYKEQRDEANATIEKLTDEVNVIGAHRFDWDDNGPEHDEWLASLGEKRLGGPDIAYRGIQYAVMRLRRTLKSDG
ncbi:hypothetical protein [Tsukamurella tyrosinosolvens]|uniref:hypothetical protein n=1 Tax=Tsukamurella tyrosinosolvens TaxID=57704 RepID=UPI0034626228